MLSPRIDGILFNIIYRWNSCLVHNLFKGLRYSLILLDTSTESSISAEYDINNFIHNVMGVLVMMFV